MAEETGLSQIGEECKFKIMQSLGNQDNKLLNYEEPMKKFKYINDTVWFTFCKAHDVEKGLQWDKNGSRETNFEAIAKLGKRWL